MSNNEYSFQGDLSRLNLDATSFNGENALFFADCAKLAYEPSDVVEQVIKQKLGFEKFGFFDANKSTEAFVAGNKNMIVVAFRGTQEIRDFFKDAELKLEDFNPGKVHHGFISSLHEVWGNQEGGMFQFIQQCRDNNQSIWFCGHSLGAALATLAAADYVLKKGCESEGVKGIYTIGQPRLGNRKFAIGFDEVMGEKCFRIVNNNDVVAKIPLRGFLLNYTHVGQQFYINSKSEILKTLSFWQKAWDQVRGVVTDFGDIGVDALHDHSSKDYVQLIKKNRSVSFE